MKGSIYPKIHISSTEKLDLIIFSTLFFLLCVLIAGAYKVACTTTIKRL